jgi:hypothetical protein
MLESFEDVPEILTQRSVIMYGLTWELSGTYQFPFGSTANPNVNKLQFTNWSNAQLEDTLAALRSGDLKLVRISDDSADSIPPLERIPRKRDRPRRGAYTLPHSVGRIYIRYIYAIGGC